jgi:hypothetical protein
VKKEAISSGFDLKRKPDFFIFEFSEFELTDLVDS